MVKSNGSHFVVDIRAHGSSLHYLDLVSTPWASVAVAYSLFSLLYSSIPQITEDQPLPPEFSALVRFPVFILTIVWPRKVSKVAFSMLAISFPLSETHRQHYYFLQSSTKG